LVQRYSENGVKVEKSRKTRSKLLKGYGDVEAIRKPEDFRIQREAFEKGVAEEVISSFNRSEASAGEKRIDDTSREQDT
jgi:hypothetical protein